MADLLALDWEGKHYEIDISSVTPREFKAIKSHTGMKAGAFLKSFIDLEDFDADAGVALLWLCRTRAGEPNVPWDDEFPAFELFGAMSRVGDPDPVVESEGEVPKAGDDSPT